MSRRPLKARRAPLVLVLCGVWFVGFEVIPLAHVVFHDVWEPHHHGAAEAHHDEGAENEPQSPGEHGKGSLAHRDLAAQVPAPSVPSIPEALLERNAISFAAYEGRPVEEPPRTHRARAPPLERRRSC